MPETSPVRYNRVLLKLSGEAFAGGGSQVDVDTTSGSATVRFVNVA